MLFHKLGLYSWKTVLLFMPLLSCKDSTDILKPNCLLRAQWTGWRDVLGLKAHSWALSEMFQCILDPVAVPVLLFECWRTVLFRSCIFGIPGTCHCDMTSYQQPTSHPVAWVGLAARSAPAREISEPTCRESCATMSCHCAPHPDLQCATGFPGSVFLDRVDGKSHVGFSPCHGYTKPLGKEQLNGKERAFCGIE